MGSPTLRNSRMETSSRQCRPGRVALCTAFLFLMTMWEVAIVQCDPTERVWFVRTAPADNFSGGISRHRRLNQEREGDAARGGMDGQQKDKHVTSYAQRHQNNYHYYSGGSSSASSSSSFSSSYYKYDDDDDESIHRRYHHSYSHSGRFSTNLSDVWLCLLTALGWTVWMISSFQATKHQKNHERFLSRAATEVDGTEGTTDTRFHDESVLVVRGNVRDVMLSGHGDGVLPMYTAVVDYIIEREQTHESIQIRKHFDTQQALEQGFANVELLVLPEEPTQSILKDDFYQQVQEERRAQQLQMERRSRRDLGLQEEKLEHDNDTLGDILEGYYCKWKRVSTCFASLLVLASLAGTVQVVCLIDPEKRWLGWLIFWIGVTLLLPLALAIHKLLVACTRWQEQPEKQGFVVQSYTTPGYASKSSGTLREACMPPSHCGAFFSDQTDNVAGSLDGHVKRIKEPSYAEVASYIVPEMSGCYFVHYPTQSKSTRHRSGAASATEMPGSFLGSCTVPQALSPNDLNEGDSNDEILSTSSVSSISDQDPTETGGRRR